MKIVVLKIILIISLMYLVISCDKVNEAQVADVKATFHCYEKMNNILTDSSNTNKLLTLSTQTYKMKRMPFYIPDVKYKMIPRENIFEMVESDGFSDCLSTLDSLADFAGIRFINEQYISCEICRIRRFTFETKLTGRKPIETH